jgi:hypothetical protein
MLNFYIKFILLFIILTTKYWIKNKVKIIKVIIMNKNNFIH